ncbi:MAG: hypothetical protein ABIK92_21745 [Pseudomonadota bacterium]
MGIEQFVPKINIPTISSLLGHSFPQQAPEDQLFEKVAEQQIDEEKDSENALFTLLDYLGRPQSAMAGILTDLVDGGDFSPFDRVGQALLGEERHRMKDFLDEVAPGKWGNVRLPDWMGGSEFDVLKEGAGFIADVLTDPLMAINTFTTIGNVGKATGKALQGFHGRQMAGSLAKTFGGDDAARMYSIVGQGKTLSKEFNDTIAKATASVGVADDASAGMIRSHLHMTELYRLHNEIIKDPYAFAHEIKSLSGRTELMDYVAPYLKNAEDPRTLLPPGLGQRLKEGAATLAAVRIPWLMRRLGIPDGQYSLIPKLFDEWSGSVITGFEKMTSHLRFNTAAGRSLTGWTTKMLKWGTGSEAGNAALSMATSARRHYLSDERVQQISDEAAQIFRNLSQGDADKVMDMLRHPHEFAANHEGFLRPREAPEHLKETIEKIRGWFDDQFGRFELTPGQKVKYFGRDQLSNRRAYDYFMNMAKSQGVDMNDMPSWRKIKNRVDKKFNRLAEKKGWDVTDDVGDLHKRELTNIETDVLRAEFAMRQYRLNTLIPDPELAYVPRFMTETAKGALGLKSFRELLKAGKLQYRGKDVLDVFNQAGLNRVLQEYDVPTLNRMAREGKLPYDFLEKVFYHARNNLKGKDRGLWDNVLGGMDSSQLSLFMENPTATIQKYMVDSNHAIKLQDKINMGVKIFAREVSEEEWNPLLGERLVLFSEEGMRARYGDNWKTIIGEPAYNMWKSQVDRSRLKSPGGLSRLIHTIDQEELNAAKAAAVGLPVHAMPTEIMEGLERFVDFSQNPTFKSGAMRSVMTITNFWKATTLAFFPAYYSRNFTNGFWQAGLADSLVPTDYHHAMKALLGSEKKGLYNWMNKAARVQGDSLTQEVVKSGWHGKPISLGDAYRHMLEENILGKGIHTADQMHITDGELVTLTKSTSKKLNKTINAATNWLFERGNEAESIHRTAHFINRLKKGDDPYQAAQSVKKFFYNFNEVSAFDKNMMPFMPFWNWTRKNTPRTFEMLITKPGAFSLANRIVHAFQSDEARDIDVKLLPRWVNKNLGVPTQVNKETGQIEVRLWNQWMGWTDLRDWIGMEPHKLAAGLLSPFIKLPIEMATNHSFYTEEDIQRYPGEPYGPSYLGMDISKMAVHGLRNIRAANELNKLISGKSPDGEKVLFERTIEAAGLRPKTYQFNVERLEKTRKFEISKRKSELKRSHSYIQKTFPGRALKIIEEHKKTIEKVK